MVWCDTKFIKGSNDKSENLFAQPFFSSVASLCRLLVIQKAIASNELCIVMPYDDGIHRAIKPHPVHYSTPNREHTKTITQISPEIHCFCDCDCECDCDWIAKAIALQATQHQWNSPITKCDTNSNTYSASTATEKTYSCMHRSCGDNKNAHNYLIWRKYFRSFEMQHTRF